MVGRSYEGLEVKRELDEQFLFAGAVQEHDDLVISVPIHNVDQLTKGFVLAIVKSSATFGGCW